MGRTFQITFEIFCFSCIYSHAARNCSSTLKIKGNQACLSKSGWNSAFQSEQFFWPQVSLSDSAPCLIVSFQERTGVQMIMIQDDPMPTGADKPLRITGDPHKVQVGLGGPVCAADFSVYTQFYTFYAFNLPLEIEKPLCLCTEFQQPCLLCLKIFCVFWFCFVFL